MTLKTNEISHELTNEPKLCHGHLSYRLLFMGLPKMFWLNSLPRCHGENPNQTPVAIIIHSHSLIPGPKAGWRFEHFSTNLHPKRQRVHLGILSHPRHRPLGASVPSGSIDQAVKSQHTSKRMKSSVAVSTPVPFSFYYCPKAYKSLESINSVYSRNFYSLLPEKGKINLIHLISKILSSEATVHYSHIS